MRFALILLVALFFNVAALADEASITEVSRVATREGVSVPVFTYWRTDALATVVLFSGGAGGYGQIGDDGWPKGGNFLIRTGRHWATYPFNLIMIGRPSDGIDLSDGRVRVGTLHAADNRAILRAIKQKSALPIWIVGTSMGTISVTAAAIEDSESAENLVAGLVLTSSVTAFKIPGAVTRQEIERIRVPTLVVHHENDACKSCLPYEAKGIANKLVNSPIKQTILVSGGTGATGNPCEALHYHGFIGMEEETVDQIANWILKPTTK